MNELSQVTQDYLKVIWTSQEWEDVKVTTKLLAQSLGVSASTASEAIRKLADQGLVSHEPYGAVTLTDEGREAAILMVRRHRLLETFLVRELGYRWDEVHDEAEILEHAVSDRLMARLDAKLGFPRPGSARRPDPRTRRFDPHARRGASRRPRGRGRRDRSPASPTPTRDAALLRRGGRGPRLCGHRREKRPFAGTISVSLDDAAPIDLGDIAARAIFVVPR